MAIRKLDQITVNGAKQLWNGYIYNFEYTPSFGQNPSYCTISLISEDGTYSIQEGDLTTLAADTINIGNNITLQMYPVNAKFDNSASGKTLTVRYIDSSIILDKKIVVLNGRQGGMSDDFTGSCYIPVGEELFTSENTPLEVLQVVYTFPELLNAIDKNGILVSSDSFTLIQNSNPYYFNTYIGSLRNVLASWCTDLGLGFYWEDNVLHFIDLSTKLILDTSAFDAAIQSAQSEEWSIEDTVGRVATAFYGQDGSRQIIAYSQDTSISFKCVSLNSLGFALTSDQINSVKAAYYGKDFFFGYHFILQSVYGNSILGIDDGSGLYSNNNKIKLDGSVLSETTLNGKYSTCWFYKSVGDGAIFEKNYEYYARLADLNGKFYYKPMVYSDYKAITNSEYPLRFCSSEVQVGQTPLAPFGEILGGTYERLDQFLIGAPYVAPDPTADIVGAFGNDSVNNSQNMGQAANLGNAAEISSSSTPYDNQAGFTILTVENQSWYLNNQPISSSEVLKENTDDGIFRTLPNQPNILDEGAIQSVMDENAANQYESLPNPNSLNIQWCAAGATNFQAYGQLGLNIVFPDVQNPNILNHVTISSPYEADVTKIEQFYRSETDKTGNIVNCNSNVIKNEINFREITKTDLLAIGRPIGISRNGVFYIMVNSYGVGLAMPALPSPSNLLEAFKLFSVGLTLSKSDPTIVRTYNLPYIDLPNNYAPKIGKGLISLNIRLDDKGINSTYTMGTRLMQVPSLEAIRTNLTFLNGSNQSRYIPYGYRGYAI